MSEIPSKETIHEVLNSYNFDIGKCIDYFIEELWFEWVVVYKDKPWFQLDYHFHKVDDYVYMLEGEFLLDIDGVVTTYRKWDFSFVPKGLIHAVRPGKWGKYIVATENGDFETIFIAV